MYVDVSSDCCGNVALEATGSSCTHSVTSTNRPCDKAINGIYDPDDRWAGDGSRTQEWIDIIFSDYFEVELIRLMQRTSRNRSIRDIQINMGSGQILEASQHCFSYQSQ